MMESMRIEIPVIPEAERTPLVVSLLAIVDVQQQRLRQLEESVQQLRDEIAVLKGQKPRPKIVPSQLETLAKPPRDPGAKRPGSQKRAKKAEFVEPEELHLFVPD